MSGLLLCYQVSVIKSAGGSRGPFCPSPVPTPGPCSREELVLMGRLEDEGPVALNLKPSTPTLAALALRHKDPVSSVGMLNLCFTFVFLVQLLWIEAMPMTGGWSDANVDDQRVKEIAAYAAEQLGTKLVSIKSAQKQVVAGMNYKLELTVQGSKHYQVTVWDRFGTLQMTNSQLIDVTDGHTQYGDPERIINVRIVSEKKG
eukprot:g901.t1